MRNIFLCSLIITIVACNNSNNINQKKKLDYYYEICNNVLFFPNNKSDTSTVIITLDVDSFKSKSVLRDFFVCFKEKLEKDKFLKTAFKEHSKKIIFSLINNHNYFDSTTKRKNFIDFELIDIADSSVYWPGRTVSNEEFVNFIINSGYVRNWEESFNNIYNENLKWEYYTEDLRFISLPQNFKGKYTKNIYPLSFKIVMQRK